MSNGNPSALPTDLISLNEADDDRLFVLWPKAGGMR